MKWIFGILCLVFAAFGCGVRIHFEKAAPLFQPENFENYYEIEFFSGRKLAGKLVNETAENFEITVGTGTAVFNKHEIKGRRLLDSAAVKSGQYADIILRSAPQNSPWLTARYEDSVFYTAEQRLGGLLSRAVERFHKESAAWNPVTAPSSRSAVIPAVESAVPQNPGLPSAGILGSAVSGLSSDNNQEQDYSAVLTAGLAQLRKSAQ